MGPKTTENMVIKSINGSSDGVREITVSVSDNSPVIQAQRSSEKKPESTYFPENMKYSEAPITQATDSNHDAGAEPKQHPTHNQFNLGLHRLNNYYSDPSLERREQLPLSPKPDSSFMQNPMQSDPKTELTPPVLPGPPPLLPDLVLKIIQFKKDACKVPSDGASDAHGSFLGIGGPVNPVVAFKAKESSDWDDDDDGDLPEFDFDAVCGVSKAPASRLPQSTRHTNFLVDSFDNRPPVEEFKHVDVPVPLPVAKPMEFAHKQQDSSFPGKPWNAYQGTTYSQTLRPEFSAKTDIKSSSSCPRSQKSRWDNDDDDDMPEWCPPELERVDRYAVVRMPLPRPASENAAPSPSEGFYGPSSRSQGPHGYQPGLLGPFSPFVDPSLPVKPRPVADFIQPDPRPPPLPSPNYSTRPHATNFSTRSFYDNRR